jgi:hypothetical protein
LNNRALSSGRIKYSQPLHVTETGEKYPQAEPYKNDYVEGFPFYFYTLQSNDVVQKSIWIRGVQMQKAPSSIVY